jgi:archaellum component FlaC
LIPELCKGGKNCKSKCKKYHNLKDFEEEFRKCKDKIYNIDMRLHENIRSLKMKDDKIYMLENKMYNMRRDLDHIRSKYEQVLRDLEISDKRSRAFEKIIVNNC